MKKLTIILSIFLAAPAFSQIYIQPQIQIGSGRTINDIISSAVPVANGVLISPPNWARAYNNPNNINNNSINNPNIIRNQDNNSNNSRPVNSDTPGTIPILNENTGSVTIPADPNVVKRVQENQRQANQQSNDLQKNIPNNQNSGNPSTTQNINKEVNRNVIINTVPSQPKVVTQQDNSYSSYSNWNGTQQEIENKANLELQEKYKAFLQK